MLVKRETFRQLDKLWKDQTVKSLDTKGKKYVILSDVHLGNGGDADDFARNRRILPRLLNHYQRQGYVLILLGDIEELWQFDLHHIRE